METIHRTFSPWGMGRTYKSKFLQTVTLEVHLNSEVFPVIKGLFLQQAKFSFSPFHSKNFHLCVAVHIWLAWKNCSHLNQQGCKFHVRTVYSSFHFRIDSSVPNSLKI